MQNWRLESDIYIKIISHDNQGNTHDSSAIIKTKKSCIISISIMFIQITKSDIIIHYSIYSIKRVRAQSNFHHSFSSGKNWNHMHDFTSFRVLLQISKKNNTKSKLVFCIYLM